MKNTYWVLFALFTMALRAFLPAHPEWVERYYSDGFFRGVRWCFDVVVGWLPFPFFYVIIIVLLWRFARGIRYLLDRKIGLKQRLLAGGGKTLAWLAGTLALFYWLWAFNYQRISMERHLDLPAITLNTAVIKAELDSQTQVLLLLRYQVASDTGSRITTVFPAEALEQAVRNEVAQYLKGIGYAPAGRPRARQPFWKGFLIRFGALGIYNPFAGECNIDQGLPDLTRPYILAHELGHGYGFADEGTCNFIAYAALKKSDQPYLRYSGELSYWRELAGTYGHLQPELYQAFWRQLPGGFQKDILHARATVNQYPEYFEAFRVKAYDRYLKSQGISEGIKNYSKVIQLVVALKQKKQ